MPSRPPTSCTYPLCPRHAVDNGRCDQHPHAGRWAGGAHGRAMPADWAATRARILQRDGYQCQWCGALASIVDHIVATALGGTEADANLQSLCVPCSTVKTAAEAATARILRRATLLLAAAVALACALGVAACLVSSRGDSAAWGMTPAAGRPPSGAHTPRGRAGVSPAGPGGPEASSGPGGRCGSPV